MSAYKNTSPFGNSITTYKGGKAAHRDTAGDSAKIKSDVQAFLDNGGVIDVLPVNLSGSIKVQVDHHVGIGG